MQICASSFALSIMVHFATFIMYIPTFFLYSTHVYIILSMKMLVLSRCDINERPNVTVR